VIVARALANNPSVGTIADAARNSARATDANIMYDRSCVYFNPFTKYKLPKSRW
jgi:hypothetical protein